MSEEQESSYKLVMRDVTDHEFTAPFRGLVVFAVLEVIRKQRRDMIGIVNIIRHQLLVDEARSGKRTDVAFGPMRDDVDSKEECLWLFTMDEKNENVTLLETHRNRILAQMRMLAERTGYISEIAGAEANMFLHSDMQDMLDQRLESLIETEDLLSRGGVVHNETEVVSLDFNQFVQVLCAGYHKHFVEELAPRDNIATPWYIDGICVLYAAVPVLYSTWRGNFKARSPFSCERWEVPLLTLLAAIALWLSARRMITWLSMAADDIWHDFEGLIIMQRVASKHHHAVQARSSIQKQNTTAFHNTITNRFVKKNKSGNESGQRFTIAICQRAKSANRSVSTRA